MEKILIPSHCDGILGWEEQHYKLLYLFILYYVKIFYILLKSCQILIFFRSNGVILWLYYICLLVPPNYFCKNQCCCYILYHGPPLITRFLFSLLKNSNLIGCYFLLILVLFSHLSVLVQYE